MTSDPVPVRGAVDPAITAELGDLRLGWLTVPARPKRSAPAVLARLRALSDRYRGARAIAMRTQPIPRAYRTFYRQIGLDPEHDRTPAERVATERLLHGALRPSGSIADACLVALVETGVPVWALDAAAVDNAPPGLGIALCDRLVVRDRSTIHAQLFGEPAAASAPGPATTAVTLFAVAVPGVPELHLDESLSIAGELLGS